MFRKLQRTLPWLGIAAFMMLTTTRIAAAAPAYKVVVQGPGIEEAIEVWLSDDEELLRILDAGMVSTTPGEAPDESDLVFELNWFYGQCRSPAMPCTEDPAEATVHSTLYYFDSITGKGHISHVEELSGVWRDYDHNWYQTPLIFDEELRHILNDHGATVPDFTCPVTPYVPLDRVPEKLQSFSPLTTFGNDILAAGLAPESSGQYYGQWSANEDGLKVLWWRGGEGELMIEGQHLDSSAETLVSYIPSGYGKTGYQSTALTFSTFGCWEITGKVGNSQLSYVVWVYPPEPEKSSGPIETACPISVPQELERIQEPAFSLPLGEYPVWLSTWNTLAWSERVRSLPPYEGLLTKFLVVVDPSVKGDLEITGQQLDGDGIVLFGGYSRQVVDRNNRVLGYAYDEPPSEVLIIPDAHLSTIASSPYAKHSSSALFPNPGCYQLTAILTSDDDEYRVEIIVELSDQ